MALTKNSKKYNIDDYRKAAAGEMTNTSNPVPQAPTIEDDRERLAARERDMAQQSAWASYQRMMKYLPTLNKQQGLAGLGVSESGRIEAANDLSNRLANADYNYDALMQQYREAGDQERKTRSSNIASQAMQMIDSARTEGDVKRILDAYKNSGSLTEDDAAYLDLYANQMYLQNPDMQKQYREAALANEGYRNAGQEIGSSVVTFRSNAEDAGLKAGDNFRLQGSDGTVYYIESGGVVPEVGNKEQYDKLMEIAKNHKDGDVFGYGRELYMYKGGKVYLIRRRKQKDNNDSYRKLYDLYFNN